MSKAKKALIYFIPVLVFCIFTLPVSAASLSEWQPVIIPSWAIYNEAGSRVGANGQYYRNDFQLGPTLLNGDYRQLVIEIPNIFGSETMLHVRYTLTGSLVCDTAIGKDLFDSRSPGYYLLINGDNDKISESYYADSSLSTHYIYGTNLGSVVNPYKSEISTDSNGNKIVDTYFIVPPLVDYDRTPTLNFSFTGSGVFTVTDFYYVSVNQLLLDTGSKEEQAAQSGSQSSQSDAQNALPDNSASLLNGVGGFISGMSYNGTDCKWTFPAVSLPAISGVMDSVQLTGQKDISFSDYLNVIPSNILTIMRAICSVAVIVFGFKEFYSTIEYVLTLRGGGDTV